MTKAVAAEPAMMGIQRTDTRDKRHPVKAVANHNKKPKSHATRPRRTINCVWKINTEPARKIVGHNPAGEIVSVCSRRHVKGNKITRSEIKKSAEFSGNS